MPVSPGQVRPLVTVSSVDVLHGAGYEMSIIPPTVAAAATPTANKAFYMPIYMAEGGTIVQFWVQNAVVAGNVDIGLYNADTLVRIVSAGSTAMSGANVLQIFDTTDTYVGPGRYYLGFACDTVTTATFMRATPALALCRFFGLVTQTTAFPLPNPMVPATNANAFWPICGFSYRVTL